MKRILFVAALVIVLTLGMASVAMANYAIHGGYLTDTVDARVPQGSHRHVLDNVVRLGRRRALARC